MDETKLNKHFVLASSSKRRLELLTQIGVKPDLILSPNIDETIFSEEIPRKYAERMSLEKNKVFQKEYSQSIILTADTVVSVGRRILPKTMDKNTAEECLNLISGRRHKVFTSFTLHTPNNSIKTKTTQSIIKFISGSYSNVVGFPLAELYRVLISIGYKFKNDE